MSRSVNKCLFIGNVGQDPEIRFLPSGKAVANLSLALNEKWKDNTGTTQEKTEWARLVGFDKTAEIIQQYVKKGSKLYVETRMQTRSWTDPSGQKKYATDFVIDRLVMLDGPQQEQQPQGYGYGDASRGY